MSQKELAQKKVDEWLAGVSEEGFVTELKRLGARLDEYGNADANMTEATFEVAKPKKVRSPRLMPLSEAVDMVVCHQAADTNPSTSRHMIPQSVPAVNEAPVAKATKRVLHIVLGLNEPTNGIAVAAGQREAGCEVELVETREFVFSTSTSSLHLSSYDEIWVHSNWWWPTIRACWKVIRAGRLRGTTPCQGPALVQMTHANLDPMMMWSKGWKKLPIWWLIERWLMNRAARVVVTCEAEREWCERAGVKGPFEIVDLKRFFRLGVGERCNFT